MKKEIYSYSDKKSNNLIKRYKVKVVAKDSNRVLIHKNVPYEHLELMKINPNLSVEVLSVKSYERKVRGK